MNENENATWPRSFDTIKLHKLEQPIGEIVDQTGSFTKISNLLEPILAKDLKMKIICL